MSENEKIRSILDEVRARFPAKPRVVDTRFELGTDAADDRAVFVTVLLHDRTPDSDWVSAKLDPIIDLIKEALYKAGVDRWCYVHFSRPKNYRVATT